MIELTKFLVNTSADVGAERNTLACLIKTPEAWWRLPQNFSENDFTVPLNKSIYTAVEYLYSKGATADPVTIYDTLPPLAREELEGLGGWSYIQALRDLPIQYDNVEFEARKLIDRTINRRILEAGEKLARIAVTDDAIDKKRNQIELAISAIEDTGNLEVANIAANGIQFLEKRMAAPKEVPGIPSGFPELDKVIQGFQSGRLYIVGARKKTGKSMLLLNWARSIAVEQELPILWISTEHSIDDEFSRLLSREAGVPEMSINNGTFSEVDMHLARVMDAHGAIKDSPFNFVSMPFFSLQKIRQLVRKMVRVYGVKAVFFDYIKPPHEMESKEWQELGALTYGLKALAEQEHIPVITAVQVNREGAQSFKLDGEIDSDHFGGSDRIAQAVSVAMVLRIPNRDEASDIENFRVLRITDNRHGPTAKFLLDFSRSVIKMDELKRL